MSSSENQNIFSKMCRLCASQNALLVDPRVNLLSMQYSEEKYSADRIFHIIERFTTIQISPRDGLPQQICQNCASTLNSMLQFQNKCKRSDAELNKMERSVGENDDQIHIKAKILDDFDTEPHVLEVEPVISKYDGLESKYENEYLFPESQEISETKARKNLDCINVDSSKIKRRKPEKKIACHICGKLFVVNGLEFHLNMHNGLKPYECDESNCISKFTSPNQLQKHQRICHIIEPYLFCDVCGKGFKQQIELNSHRSYHFDPELPCKICHKLFRNPRALKQHNLVHSQERKYPCDICTKKFQTRYTLRIHKRVHTQERPYSCHCGASFAHNCVLKAHTKKYHKTEKEINCLPSSS